MFRALHVRKSIESSKSYLTKLEIMLTCSMSGMKIAAPRDLDYSASSNKKASRRQHIQNRKAEI